MFKVVDTLIYDKLVLLIKCFSVFFRKTITYGSDGVSANKLSGFNNHPVRNAGACNAYLLSQMYIMNFNGFIRYGTVKDIGVIKGDAVKPDVFNVFTIFDTCFQGKISLIFSRSCDAGFEI